MESENEKRKRIFKHILNLHKIGCLHLISTPKQQEKFIKICRYKLLSSF